MTTTETETCAYCGEDYPAPVGHHHDERECLREQGLRIETRTVVEEAWGSTRTVLLAGHGGEQLDDTVFRPGMTVHRQVSEWAPDVT